MNYAGIDFGVIYRYSEQINISMAVRNLIGRSYKVLGEDTTAVLPMYTTLGTSMRKGTYLFAADIEILYGSFGSVNTKEAEFIFLKSGMERELNDRSVLRWGLIYPVRAYLDSVGDMRAGIPDPKIGPTFGAGFRFDSFVLDTALYGDALKSYAVNRPVISGRVTASWFF